MKRTVFLGNKTFIMNFDYPACFLQCSKYIKINRKALHFFFLLLYVIIIMHLYTRKKVIDKVYPRNIFKSRKVAKELNNACVKFLAAFQCTFTLNNGWELKKLL